MKTLCLTLGLLLLIFCCCNAMPTAVQDIRAHRNCCSKFRSSEIPIARVANITQSHRSCLKKAFIVTTVLGRRICYRMNFDWALKVFKQFDNIEGSSFQ